MTLSFCPISFYNELKYLKKQKFRDYTKGAIVSIKLCKKKYSPEIKAVTVQAYLSGKMSRWEICKIFNIPAERTLKL